MHLLHHSPTAAVYLLLSLCGILVSNAMAAEQTERLRLEGLKAPVEIVVDHWGVAHIYAENEPDLFFAQGYHAARDRTFQFEMWRRQATGTVSEILGERELERDIGARLLRFRGDLSRELNHYHVRGEQIIRSFTNGINAWIEQTCRNPELLPLEFRLLGIEPGLWTPEVVVSRHQGLVHNLMQELDLGRAVAAVGSEQVRELVWFHPGQPDLTLDEAVDGKLLSADILKLYRSARSPLRFRPEDVVEELRLDAASWNTSPIEVGTLAGRRNRWSQNLWNETVDNPDIGSNNWVLSGRCTETGSTIMANDPH